MLKKKIYFYVNKRPSTKLAPFLLVDLIKGTRPHIKKSIYKCYSIYWRYDTHEVDLQNSSRERDAKMFKEEVFYHYKKRNWYSNENLWNIEFFLSLVGEVKTCCRSEILVKE